MKRIYLLILAMFIGIGSINAQKPISQADWVLLEADSEEPNREAPYAFDGDVSTFWHTEWSLTDPDPPFPHHMIVDLGKSYDMIGFEFTPRVNYTVGVPDTMSFWTSVDNVTWDSVAGGLWDAPYSNVIRTEAFTKTGRYIKFIGESGQPDQLHMHCAEFNILVLGTKFTADQTVVMRGESVSFTDESGNDPVEWEWIFEGGTPATSTDQNPTVVYNIAGNYDVTLITKPVSGDDTQNDTLVRENYITADSPNISQADWSIVYVDSELGARPVVNLFDGDPATFWHDNWSDVNKPLYPHTIIFDLGATYDLEGFSYAPRSGGGNGTIAEHQLYITKELPDNDIGATWETAVHSGLWTSPWDVERNEFFATPKIGRYVIFYMLSDRNNNPSDASGSEFNMKGSLYGAAFTANKTEIFASQTINFTDLSSGAPAGWEWTFEGGDPATSGDQNPIVKYSVGDTLDVSLVMTPQAGVLDNDTLVKEDYIIVKATPTVKSLAKDDWTIIDYDSEEVPTGGFAVNMIDGDPETIWHTAWANQLDLYPHYVIIDLGANYDMVGFEYAPRSGGANGTVAQYEVLTSIDAETYVLADSGTWDGNWADTRTEMFESPIATPPVNGRFVKFLAKSEKNGGEWASCSEFNILVAISGAEFGSNATFTEKGGSIDFVDFSSGDPTGWLWTFEGGTPATSTEQSPGGIVYSELGTYEVTLVTTGGTAAGTLTKTDFITVNYLIPNVGANYVYVDTVEFGNAFANYTDNSEEKYVHYVDMPFEVYRGESYKLHVNHTNIWGDNAKRYQFVWVDWDNDGVLDADEQVMTGGIDTVDVVVPADAVLGETRMRVVGRYHEPGDYSDAYGGFSDGEVEDYTITIAELSADIPVAEFSAESVVVCVESSVQFNDMSTNTPTAWSWTFEGGTPAVSSQKNPIVTYVDAGVYDVSLTATQTSGSDDEVKTDMITANALPAVSAGDDLEVCFGAEVTLSGSGADTYEWDNDVLDGVAFAASNMTYAVTGTDANGCTNTDTVVVAVDPKIDFTVTETDGVLTVDATGATFQWIDCSDNSDVAGATDGQFTPTVTGDYAVVVTVGSCSATSACTNVVVVGINGQEFGQSISIYPNPSSGMINVAIERDNATIKIYNTLGALVFSREKTADIEQFEISTQGLYIIQIKSEGDVYTTKLVVD